MSSLTALSAELLVRILGNLDARSLLRCESVSRFFRDILKGSSALRYIVELGFHGISDGGSKLSSSELISRLKQRQESWEALDWKKVVDFPMNRSYLTFEFVGGILGIAERYVLTFLSLPFWRDGDREGGHVVGLPLNPKTWMMDVAIKDLTFDPSQDLSVILEDVDNPMVVAAERVVHLHLRTISGNVPHPLAPLPVITITVPPTPAPRASICNTVVQVVDDVLSVFFCRGANSYLPRVIIWNWKKGWMLYDSATSDLDLPPSTCHFSLLTRTTFILTSTVDPSGALLVFSFSSCSNAVASVPLLCSIFLLPEINAEYSVRNLEVRKGRTEGRELGQDLFMARPEDGLLVVAIKYQYGESDAVNGNADLKFSLYVHVQTLLRHSSAQALLARSGVEEQFEMGTMAEKSGGLGSYNEDLQLQMPLDISNGTDTDAVDERLFDWPTWGPGKAQFLASVLPNERVGYMYGQRIVLGEHDSVDVSDLGPISLRREPTDVPGGYNSTINAMTLRRPIRTTCSTAKSKSHTLTPRFCVENVSDDRTSISMVTESVASGFVNIKDEDSEARFRLFVDSKVYSRLPMRVSTRTADVFADINMWLIDGKRLVGMKLDPGTGGILGLRIFLF